MVEFLSFWSYPLGMFTLVGLAIWHCVYSSRKIAEWENSPEQVAIRQKQAYDAAHAYLGGKPCCGRNQD